MKKHMSGQDRVLTSMCTSQSVRRKQNAMPLAITTSLASMRLLRRAQLPVRLE